ncbi:hypothetical protein TRFO_13525 [Tritrichomonas foetus]|uniref:Uncharacterized protein n=1 Tax=Tritrichomonas foetus TaxID=1144522 RepID=A0A1J4L243_9EUKA|nr:hypothetical protein TRFO_13525 [Tritrichomonas foetus]|eukprot:OHT16036.1 hypothetical protein TRFO_13525 [Tritrichomonas foetus]
MNQLLTFDEETERKKESIEGRHVSEIRYLESKWKSYRLRPYSKVTPMLRDMINHEDISKATGNIEMAKYLNEKIAQKRKKEVSEQQFIADSEYKMNLDLLLKKQAKELDNYIDTRAHKRELIVIKQQKELMAAECKTSVVLDWYHKKPKEPLVPVPLPTRGLVKPHIHQKQKKGVNFCRQFDLRH